jgi:hypothetical protein
MPGGAERRSLVELAIELEAIYKEKCQAAEVAPRDRYICSFMVNIACAAFV